MASLKALFALACCGVLSEGRVLRQQLADGRWGKEGPAALAPDSLLEVDRRRWLGLAGIGAEHHRGDLGLNLTALADAWASFVRTHEWEGSLTPGEEGRLEALEDRAAKQLKELDGIEEAKADRLDELTKRIEATEQKLEGLPADHADRAGLQAQLRAMKEEAAELQAGLRDVADHKAKLLEDLEGVARRRGGEVKDAMTKSEQDLDKAMRSLENSATLPPAYKEMGVKINNAEDWFAFLLAVGTNFGVLTGCVLFFSFFRQRYRLVYQRNNWSNWEHSQVEERSEIVDGKCVYARDRSSWTTKTAAGDLPQRLVGTFFDWVCGSIFLHSKEVISCAGLDQAMLIEFTNMGITVFLGLALPCLLAIIPMHIWGGNAAKNDYLSWQGFANVEKGSWQCWVHAFFVWYVVLWVDGRIYKFQTKFVPWRVHWLQTQSHLQSCTILVENIPLKYRTPLRLRRYVNSMFGDREVVEHVHLLAHTEQLTSLIATREAAKLRYERAASDEQRTQMADLLSGTKEDLQAAYSTAQAEVVAERFRLKKLFERIERDAAEEERDREERERIEREEAEEEARLEQEEAVAGTPTAGARQSRRRSVMGTAASAAASAAASMAEQESAAAVVIQRRWKRRLEGGSAMLLKGFKSSLGMSDLNKPLHEHALFLTGVDKLIVETYSSTAFVTFHTRYDAIMARRLAPYKPDRGLFVISEAPDPSDVCYDHLKKDPLHWKPWRWVGVGLIGLLFLMFLPTIAFISSVSNLDNLATYSPGIKDWADDHAKLAGMWNGLAGALGLNLALGFLPTILNLIAQVCFKQVGHSWSQLQLEKLYFLFLIVFQLLVVSIANSMINALVDFVNNPLSLVERLSLGMCRTTHFYLNIFVLQWATMGMEFTRYLTLIKYWLWKRICATPLDAINASEPEDQDYYGIGARCARCASVFVIGIAFVSLCPLMSVLGLISFVLLRIFLGYQVVYAETRKPDIGGQFFVLMLKQCQWGLVIYVLCMVGVLLERASTRVPAFVAGLALLYVAESIYVFDDKFFWQAICHEQVMERQRAEERAQEEGKDLPESHKPSRDSYAQPELASTDLAS